MKTPRHRILTTMTDIKVFLLFLLDNIGQPLEQKTIISIVEENTGDISLDYEECLYMLVKSGHLLYDEVFENKYYMISDKGRMVASELYDTLDKSFRERSLRAAIRYISLVDSGARINSYITVTDSKRYRVTMEAFDKYGEVMSTSITVNSRAEAEMIKENYERRPDGVYRGVLFSATGRLGYIANDF